MAVIIDFGRSELEATDRSLNDEYDELYRELKFNYNNSKGIKEFLLDPLFLEILSYLI